MILWIEDSAQNSYQLGKDSSVDLVQTKESQSNADDYNPDGKYNTDEQLVLLQQILDLTLQVDGKLINHCSKSMNLYLSIKNIVLQHGSLIDCVGLIANFQQFVIICQFIKKYRSELFYTMLNNTKIFKHLNSTTSVLRRKNALYYISLRNIYSVTNSTGQKLKERDTISMLHYVCHEIDIKFGQTTLISALNASPFDNVRII